MKTISQKNLQFGGIWHQNHQKIVQTEFFGHFLDFSSLVFLDFAYNDHWPSQCILVSIFIFFCATAFKIIRAIDFNINTNNSYLSFKWLHSHYRESPDKKTDNQIELEHKEQHWQRFWKEMSGPSLLKMDVAAELPHDKCEVSPSWSIFDSILSALMLFVFWL